MAQIRAIEARSLLDEIAQDAKQRGVTLIEQISDAKRALNDSAFRNGRVLASASGSGQSTSFQLVSSLSVDYTQTRVNAQLMEFKEIYADCISNSVFSNDSSVEAQLAGMLQDDRLQSVSSARTDLTGIRFPATPMQMQ